MITTGYFRYPSIAGNKIVFVSEDDLWEVPADGGLARRLTAGWGAAVRPWVSPDGRLIAFVGKEEGDNEIYVMDAGGGPVRRLTYLGATSVVAGWLPDGRIVFASNYGKPFRNWTTLWAVAADGTGLQELAYGPANNIAFGPEGQVVIGRNTGDPARWKRYRGGTRGVLWVDADGSGTFRRFEGVDGNCASPMWVGGRIYFLSDHEGVGNLYSMAPTGRDLVRHTHHEDFYVRNASTDGQRIVYHAGGSLYVFNPATGEERLVPVEYLSQRTQREIRYVDAAKYLNGYALHPEGHSLLVTTRGKLYALGNWEGPVTSVGRTDGVRYRLSRWTPDGQAVVTVSDEGGEEALEIWPVADGGLPVRMPGDIGRPLTLKLSPDGRYAALTNHRHELWLADLTTYRLERLDVSHSGLAGLDWSPDSAWIAYGFHDTAKTSIIKLYRMADGTIHPITRPVLRDVSPVFDPGGQYLYFLSYRLFDPVYDNLKFDLGFPNGMRPYLIPLAADTPSPFMPAPRPVGGRAGDKGWTGDGKTPPPVRIDLDGIADRVLAFPVSEGRFVQLKAQPGAVFWTTVEPEGSLGHSFLTEDPPHKAVLHKYDLTELKDDVLAQDVADFALSPDGQTMAIRAGRRLRVLKAGEKVDPKKDKPGRESGLVDLKRITVPVFPPAEWAQMLREAWRLMRDNFWTADMSGVDWEAIYQRYLDLLPKVATRGEFSDLMWEMQGELGTSHAYELGGDYRPEPRHKMGTLAADLSWSLADGGYRIDGIVAGDSWQPGHDSPLRTPGANLRPGDVIVSVDGRPVGPDVPPGALLIDKAGREVRLAVKPGDGGELRSVVIKPLESEMNVRYRQWVETNRRVVDLATGGRIGYVHIPDMGPRGFAEFYRAYLVEAQKDGLIVDVRFNGGGHVSELVLTRLARRRLGYDVSRHGVPEPYPVDTVIGPLVAITNEHAGSDGDIFSHAFKMMGLGPLIGTRTWGGVIGISVRHALVDGSITTQPEFSFWFSDVGWDVENYGTDPDIPVENTPQDYRQGVDAQLDRAIREALERLAQNPPVLPAFDRRPNRAQPLGGGQGV